MSDSVALFDPGSGSFAKIIDGVLQTGTSGGNATTVEPVAVTTPTLSNVASSASNTTLLAANVARIGAVIFNDSTAVLRAKFGATASATSFTYKLNPGDTLTIDSSILYQGIIDGIWESANGFARVTEMA